MKILIVEDDKTQSDILAKLLKRVGGQDLQIHCAFTLSDGLEKARTCEVNIILLDLCLPDALPDWHTTLRATRDFHCPVIIVTGMADPDKSIMLECMKYNRGELGVQQVFAKPIGAEIVVAQLLDSAATAHLRKVMPSKLAPAGHGQ